MDKVNSKTMKLAMIFTGIIVFLIIAATIGANANKETKTDKKESKDSSYEEALDRCTVMEAADLYKTGTSAENVFDEGRRTCNTMAKSYDNTNEFISDVEADWKNRKDEQIDGHDLEYHLQIIKDLN